MRYLLLALVFILCSCNKASLPSDTRLLLNLEERISSEDTIINYQVFENGLIERIVTHDTSKPENLYSTSYQQLDKEKLSSFQEKILALKKLDYQNDFPWKEDFTKRGNIYKFQFIDEVKTQAFDNGDTETVLVPSTYYYYSGLQDEPKLFQEIIDVINSHSEHSSVILNEVKNPVDQL